MRIPLSRIRPTKNMNQCIEKIRMFNDNMPTCFKDFPMISHMLLLCFLYVSAVVAHISPISRVFPVFFPFLHGFPINSIIFHGVPIIFDGFPIFFHGFPRRWCGTRAPRPPRSSVPSRRPRDSVRLPSSAGMAKMWRLGRTSHDRWRLMMVDPYR